MTKKEISRSGGYLSKKVFLFSSLTILLVMLYISIDYFKTSIISKQPEYRWSRVISNNPFPGRSGHASISFKNKLWVIGGFDGTGVRNDIWFSSDGKEWKPVRGHLPFRKRALFSLSVFMGRLWIIGGLYFSRENNIKGLNDVWSSRDGENWVLVRKNAEFEPRGAHSSYVFKNRLWVAGGITGRSEIWCTFTGEKWFKSGGSTPFGARGGAASVIYKGKVWLIGGFYVDGENNFHSLSDVWCSKDGVNWHKTADNTSFFAGGGHSALEFKDRILVMGGFRKSGNVFITSNGMDWNNITYDISFGERVSHTSTVFKKRLFVIGGYDGSGHMNDIWYIK